MPALTPIVTGDSSLVKLASFLKKKFRHTKIFVLTDENTSALCLPVLMKTLQPLQLIEIKIKPGEQYKNLDTCSDVWSCFIENGADRKSLLLNLGGGVVCDLGGFAASVFKRGIRYIHIPTTLLAMTDAAIGGKTAVDLNSYKNQVGTFSLPVSTYIYLPFLKTLPAKELNSGKAEIIKHALVADKKLWNKISKSFVVSGEVIKKSIAIKTGIVEKDFREKDIRNLLNFGHTIGHALESYYMKKKKSIAHGHAIAAGMIVESAISLQEQLITSEHFHQISRFIGSNYSFIGFPAYKELKHFLLSDKKNREGKINFTLLKSPGKGIINQEISDADIISSIKIYTDYYARHKNNRSPVKNI